MAKLMARTLVPVSPLPDDTDFKFISFNCTAANTPDSSAEANAVTLNNSSSWTYCGPLIPLTGNNLPLPSSFHNWAATTINGSVLPTLLPFLTFVHSFLAAVDISHYWITIRATQSTHDFDIPRWHTDDLFFDGNARTGLKLSGYWKLATTILGPGTLFVEDGATARAVQANVKKQCHDQAPEHSCTSIRCLGCATTSDVIRGRLAKDLASQRVVQARPGECTFFKLGEQEGAVHSEPPCHGDRIFVNVIPGTEKELRGLMSKWGMEFPRAWSVGVPLHFTSGEESATNLSMGEEYQA
ncbi:hypothetical protein K432DRAFT_324881 [Lepidopterella palustris CBS 459.81]|uniref:Uncharacterized protein n=1 Tax=Lepidopterella palustris CBS 459.81 TaxID=1314670 RepID=A0A8E2EDW3_9PEZI|nr:hypothetical protein K432DRAFT_324881 [Lepidopterella palustris CBS 459.81]